MSVFGVGNAIVDVLVSVNDSVLAELGMPKGIMTLVDEARSKEILKSVELCQRSIMPGGSCCNTMIGVANLGGRAGYTGIVGNDGLGDLFEEKLKGFGVSSNIVRTKGMTGSSVIMVSPDCERSMNTHLGVCGKLDKKHIIEEDLLRSKIFHTTAYFYDTCPETCLYLLELARRNGIKVSFDVSDPFLAKNDDLKKIVKYADIVFLNRDEARLFQDRHTLQEIGKYASTVVVKVGANGSFVCHKGKYYKIPAFRVNAVDTTGAGDMFAAGFLFGITQGYKVQEAAHIGSFAASKVVEVTGARLDYSLKKEVEERFW
ncbi:MAG: adenosine kinase [Candidatus Woesearchaeota archaeon]